MGDPGAPTDGPGREATHAGEPRPPEDAQRRLDRLREATRFFAHDLKNPLSAVLLGLQRLARFAGPDHQAQARALTGRLEASVQTMNRLVEGLADLARYLGGELQLELTRTPAAQVIGRAVDRLRPAAGERRQELALEIAGELPAVEWDVERISQALHHLLSRALHSSPEEARIQCLASSDAGGVRLAIHGQPHRATDPTLGPPDGGAPRKVRDLGVLVARALAEAHGGDLEIEDIPDRGVSFRLLLPLRPPAR